MQYKTLNA